MEEKRPAMPLCSLNLEIVHASQTIEMHEKPSRIARTKADSSMMVGMNLIKNGQADAFVTAGNTGAALTLATLHTLRRVPGVRRPALTSLIRVENDHLVVMVDLGANTDTRPEWLLQFGIMGSLYAERVLDCVKPRVALLSNGEEEGKGNSLVRDTVPLFVGSNVNFIGNVEPKEVLEGAADVVVTDGFVGNIMLKSLEAVGDAFFRVMRRELMANPLRMLGAFLTQPVLRKIHKQVDPFEIGGAPLLGVNGVVIVGHGRTNAKGIHNAIRQARRAVKGQIIEAIRDGMIQYAGEEDEIELPLKAKPARRKLFRWRRNRRLRRSRRPRAHRGGSTAAPQFID
jgi:glycerol-3-phosphate acyltransferase PlsX